MADTLAMPDCMIVSSSRANDLANYIACIYKAEEHVWRDIFPWEFPQNASRATEEEFLRQYFSDEEIHMQGGAKGDGNGYRFLKQVWLDIALWNLEKRIPAVERMYWDKPESTANLLSDPMLQEFFFKPDVAPVTFFDKGELAIYGEKFLKWVIPSLQQTAKRLLEEQQQAKDLMARNVTQEVISGVKQPSMKTAHNERTAATLDKPVTHQQAEQPVLPEPAALPVLSNRQELHPPIGTGLVRNRLHSSDYEYPPDVQPFHNKRRDSGSRRFSNRGGHTSDRRFSSHGNRNEVLHYEEVQAPLPSVQHGYPRIASGDLMPDAVRLVPLQEQLGPRFGQTAHQQPGWHPHGVFHPAHPEHYTRPYTDRNNRRYSGNALDSDPYFMQYQGLHGNGAARSRDDQRKRGVPARGHGSTRGRGSRGRPSISGVDQMLFDQTPFKTRDYDKDRGGLHGLHEYNSQQPKKRRGSLASDSNRRGNHQQQQSSRYMLKENLAPVHVSEGHSLPPLTYIPHHSDPQGAKSSSRVASHDAPSYSGQTRLDFDTLNARQRCGADWIGADCTYVDKMMIFDVPASVNNKDVKDFFNADNAILEIRRVDTVGDQHRFGPGSNVFLTFRSHQDARRCFERKPKHWIGGRSLRMEVPKEFWEPHHNLFKYHFYHSTYEPFLPGRSDQSHPPSVALLASDSRVDHSQQWRQQKRSEHEAHSVNITPSVSETSTPQKRPKKRKQGDLLRKASTAAADQQAEATYVEDPTPEASCSAVTPKNSPARHTILSGGRTTAVGDAASYEQQGGLQDECLESSSPLPRPSCETKEHHLDGRSDRSSFGAAEQQVQKLSASETEQSSAQPLKTITESDQPSRENTEASKAAENPGLDEQTNGSFEKAMTSVVSDETHADNSFHMSSSSAGTDLPAASIAMEAAMKDSLVTSPAGSDDKTANLRESREFDNKASRTAPSPESTTTGRPLVRVRVPQAPLDKTTASRTSQEMELDMVRRPDNLVDGDQAVPATPTFLTAPNTPAVAQDQTEPDAERLDHATGALSDTTVSAMNAQMSSVESGKAAVTKREVSAARKSDKTKGPSQTESLSLFGKRQEKRPKPKKGTLKGKPKIDGKESQTASSTASLGPGSGTVTPSTEATSSSKKRTDDAGGVIGTASSIDALLPPGTTILPGLPAVTETVNTIPSPPAPHETPSKHRSIGELFGGFFGTGPNTFPTTKQNTSQEADPPMNVLTEGGSQDLRPKIETEQVGSTDDAMTVFEADECETVESAAQEISRQVESSQPVIDAPWDNDIVMEDNPSSNVTLAEVGLGIYTSAVGSEPSTQSSGQSQKNKRKKKSKKKVAPDDVIQAELSTPTVVKPSTFRFGEDLRSGDDRSETSSRNWLGENTPSSEAQLASVSTSARKLPLTSVGQEHIVKAKGPRWKEKKRTRLLEPECKDDAEVDSILIVGKKEDSEIDSRTLQTGASSTTIAGPNIRETIYVWTGPGVDAVTDDEGNRELSKGELRTLAMDELNRSKQVVGTSIAGAEC